MAAGAILAWATPEVFGDGQHPWRLGVATLLFIDLYLMAGILLRQTVGHQLRLVVDPPNAALFRAQDLPPLAVFIAYSAVPTVMLYAALMAANAVAIWVIGPANAAVGEPWWIMLGPAVGLLATLGIVATLAVRPRPARLIDKHKTIVMLIVLAAAGVGIGRLSRAVQTGTFAALDMAWLISPPLSTLVAAMGLVGVVAWLALWRLVVLARYSFRLPTVSASGERPKSALVGSSAYHRSAREFWAHPSSKMVGSGIRALVAVMAFVLGLTLGGVNFDRGVFGQWVMPMTNGYLFVTLLIMVGLTFSIVGPSTMISHYRFEWENSTESSFHIAVRAMFFHLFLVTPPAVAVAAVQFVVSGSVSAKPLAMAWALVGAATIGETLVPARIRVDGTSTPGPLAPFVILLLTAPTLGLGTGAWWTLIQCAYGAALLGAGIQCLSKRISHLPLNSTVSPPDIEVTAALSSTR